MLQQSLPLFLAKSKQAEQLYMLKLERQFSETQKADPL